MSYSLYLLTAPCTSSIVSKCSARIAHDETVSEYQDAYASVSAYMESWLTQQTAECVDQIDDLLCYASNPVCADSEKQPICTDMIDSKFISITF